MVNNNNKSINNNKYYKNSKNINNNNNNNNNNFSFPFLKKYQKINNYKLLKEILLKLIAVILMHIILLTWKFLTTTKVVLAWNQKVRKAKVKSWQLMRMFIFTLFNKTLYFLIRKSIFLILKKVSSLNFCLIKLTT